MVFILCGCNETLSTWFAIPRKTFDLLCLVSSQNTQYADSFRACASPQAPWASLHWLVFWRPSSIVLDEHFGYRCLTHDSSLNIHPIFLLNTVVSFRPCPIGFLISNCSHGALPQLFAPANIALLERLSLLYGSVRLSWCYLLNKIFVCDKSY